VTKTESVARYAAAGALAGLAGAFVMNGFQRMIGERMHGESRGHGAQSLKDAGGRMDDGSHETPNTRAASAVAQATVGKEPSDEAREVIGIVGHYAVGAALGAAYGAAALGWPAIRTGYGSAFAAGVWALVDEVGMSATGLSRPAWEYPGWVHASSLAAHVIYGAVTDVTLRGFEEVLS
jgi:uncharacterized membrane protein YagU involved in acid resistance